MAPERHATTPTRTGSDANRGSAIRAAALLTALLGLAVLVGSLTGCSSPLAFFNRTTAEDYDLDAGKIKEIQFYLDKPFTLIFQSKEARSRIRDHGVDATKLQFEHRIDVVEKAGGEALAVGEDWIKVRVAYDMVLEFRPDRRSPRGTYYLRTINDQLAEHGGTIFYRDQYYQVYFGTVERDRRVVTRGRPRLLYAVSSVQRRDRKRTEITGIWLEEQKRREQEQQRISKPIGEDP